MLFFVSKANGVLENRRTTKISLVTQHSEMEILTGCGQKMGIFNQTGSRLILQRFYDILKIINFL